ncbi:MAG: mannonate dehydratase [Ferruginibacter sp.]
MKLSFLFFGNQPDEKWQLCKQMGIDYAIAKLAPELTGEPSIDNYNSFARSKEIFEEQGFKLIGLEGDQMDMTNIKLGLNGREKDIDRYCKMLENMGRLGVDFICYNFMFTGWYRTHNALPERGGALVSGFNYESALKEPDNKYACSENKMGKLQWFIDR